MFQLLNFSESYLWTEKQSLFRSTSRTGKDTNTPSATSAPLDDFAFCSHFLALSPYLTTHSDTLCVSRCLLLSRELHAFPITPSCVVQLLLHPTSFNNKLPRHVAALGIPGLVDVPHEHGFERLQPHSSFKLLTVMFGRPFPPYYMF